MDIETIFVIGQFASHLILNSPIIC